MPKLTNRCVESICPGEKEHFVWDTELRGFGVRVYPSGRKSFFLQYRFGNRNRRDALGQYPLVSSAKARSKALKALAGLVEGVDPQVSRHTRKDLTVSELCDLYMEEGFRFKKPSTVKVDEGRIERHIKPLIGNRFVRSVQRKDIEQMQFDIADGKTAVNKKNKKKYSRTRVCGGRGTASRTVGLTGGIFSFAVERGLAAENPVRGVRKFPDNQRDRVLSKQEWSQIGEALEACMEVGQTRKAAIRFLMVSGCRRGEVQGLEWSHVDLEYGLLRLPDSKTGAKIVPLGDEAVKILSRAEHIENCPYVFSGRGGVQMRDLSKSWKKICRHAHIEDCRLHDLRHQFATIGVTQGEGDRLYVVSQLLGHKDSKTTQRYAHLQHTHLQNTASDIGNLINGLLKGKTDASHI